MKPKTVPKTVLINLPFQEGKAEIEVKWADGWSPEKVQKILEEDFFRVGFKASSLHILSSSIFLGNVIRRCINRRDKWDRPIVNACSSSAVHLAWQPYHFAQSPGKYVLALAIMSDSHPGAVGSGKGAKMFGTEYTIVAIADSNYRYWSWWRNLTRKQGLALFDVQNIVGSRMKNRPVLDKKE